MLQQSVRLGFQDEEQTEKLNQGGLVCQGGGCLRAHSHDGGTDEFDRPKSLAAQFRRDG